MCALLKFIPLAYRTLCIHCALRCWLHVHVIVGKRASLLGLLHIYTVHIRTYIYQHNAEMLYAPLGGRGGGLGGGSSTGLSGIEAAVSNGTNALPLKVEQTTHFDRHVHVETVQAKNT